MRVAVVDDQLSAQDKLISYLEKNADALEIRLQIDRYNDGISLIDQFHNQYDLIYLDVEMEILDGMSTAKKIRERDPNTILVFVTNHAQVAIQGYAVEASDFLLKPLAEFTFQEHFRKIVKKMNALDGSIVVKVSGTTKKLLLHDIIYIESQGHYIDFVTKEFRVTTIDSMKNIEAKLPKERFFRISNSVIINYQHIDEVQRNDVIMKDVVIKVSRARKKEFQESYAAYLGNQLI